MYNIGALALLWLVAFGVRWLYIEQSQSSPFFDFPLVDAKTYTNAAREMVASGNWSWDSQPFWQPPLYVYFLAVLYSLSEPGYYLPRLVQAGLGASSCALIYLLGRRVFTPAVGWVAAGLATLYGPLFFFDAEFLPPVLAVFLNLLGLLALLWASRGSFWRPFLPGFLLGLSALCIGNILLFLPAAAAWLFRQHGQAPRRQRLLRLLPLALGLVLAIAPVTWRNYAVGDDLVLISSNAGLNFYIGNNADYDRTVQIQPGGPAWLALVTRPRTEAGVTRPSAQSGFFFTQAWDFIRTQPLTYLRLQFYKAYLFWHGDEIGRNQDLYFARQYSSLLQVLLWKHGLAYPFGLLAPLALVGLVLNWRNGLKPASLLLLTFLGVYSLSVVLFFISARYRLPAIPALLLFAVYGGRELWALWRQSEHRHFVKAIIALALLLAVCNYRVGSMDMEGNAHTQHKLGFVYQEKRLPANAVAAYRKALELDPNIMEAHFNLAVLHARRGHFDLAIDQYREFIRRFPDIDKARLALGDVFLQTRRYSEATSVYERLVTTDDQADVQGRLAYAYTQLGQIEKATRAYQELISLRPESLLARYQLGQLYEGLTQIEAAQSQYEAILALDSTHFDARYRLAYLLFLQDQPETAKIHLKRIIAQDPSAVDARWLLAAQYVVEHRGDDALEQAQAILEVQPDHLQANRIAGHLHIIQGDTLKGIEYLDLLKKYYVEDRQSEIFEQLKEKWRGQIKGKGR